MRNEWSLIMFTLLVQLAIGAFILISIVEISSHISENVIIIPLKSQSLFIILLISFAAMISSFLHLGKPKNALYAVSNIKTSWLSKEIIYVVLFVGIVSLNLIVELIEFKSNPIKIAIILSGVFIGFLAIFSMSRLYMLKTVPVWNSYDTIIQFFSSTFTLGVVFILILFVFSGDIASSTQIINPKVKIFFTSALIIWIIRLLSTLVKIRVLKVGTVSEMKSYKMIVIRNKKVFIAHIILSIILLVFFLFQISIDTYFSVNLLSLFFAIVLIAEILGRYLFYASYNRIGI